MKTGGTNHSICPISVSEPKWGNGASPDWSKRKCLSEGERCMCVWNTEDALPKAKWTCVYMKNIKLWIVQLSQKENVIDALLRPISRTWNICLKLPIQKRNGAGLKYCVHGFIVDHCSLTPITLLRRARLNPTTMFLFCRIVHKE